MTPRNEQTERLPPDLATGIRLYSNACLPLGLPDDMSFEGERLERGRSEPSGDDVVRTRVGGNGVSAGLPDTGSEVVTLRVWCAVPVHDKLIVDKNRPGMWGRGGKEKTYPTVLNGLFVSFSISFI